MRDKKRLILLIAGCAILFGGNAAFAQGWPQWRGVNRDGHASGFEAPAKWPDQLAQKWRVTVGTGCATPALVGDKLYVFTRQGSDEVLSCLDAGSGKILWSDKYATREVTGAASRHPGPRSSPTVADDKIVALGVGGVLSCWDTSGKRLWQEDPFPGSAPRFFTSTSPIVVDGMVICHLGKEGAGAIIAYELASGQEKWRWDGAGPDYGSAVLLSVAGTKQIAAPTEKSVVGLAVADGKLLWELPSAPPRRAYNASTPIVDGQTVIYSAKGRGTKALKIVKQGDGFKAEQLWNNDELGVQYNTPVLENGLLFGMSDSGNLFCINAKTGATAWKDSQGLDRGGFGQTVAAGSVIMALPSSSDLIVFKPSAAGYTELAKIKVADSPSYATPVAAGKAIYVKDQESLIKLTVN